MFLKIGQLKIAVRVLSELPDDFVGKSSPSVVKAEERVEEKERKKEKKRIKKNKKKADAAVAAEAAGGADASAASAASAGTSGTAVSVAAAAAEVEVEFEASPDGSHAMEWWTALEDERDKGIEDLRRHPTK